VHAKSNRNSPPGSNRPANIASDTALLPRRALVKWNCRSAAADNSSSAENSILPYGFYANMGKADIAALVAFLRAVKPVVKAVK